MTEKRQLPKAYLRLDPNIDQTHPDRGAMVDLMCAANRQPERGRFKSRTILETIFGRVPVRRYVDRGDVVQLADGRWYAPGWDEWQEGDWTVGERVARIRARRKSTVTPPLASNEPTVTPPLHEALLLPLPPSEALGRKGVRTSTEVDTRSKRVERPDLSRWTNGRVNPSQETDDERRERLIATRDDVGRSDAIREAAAVELGRLGHDHG